MFRPELIAHRGYPARHPENTLPAIEAALAAGARHIEIDVQTTRDHVPVLFHDATLDRLCGVPGRIRDYDLAELGALRAYDPARFDARADAPVVPTLVAAAALLEKRPDVTLYVEVKSEALEHSGVDRTFWHCEAALAPLAGHAVFIAFDAGFLCAVRRHGWPRVGGIVEHWAQRFDGELPEAAPDILFVDLAGLPAQGALALPGCRLAVYEVDDPATARILAARGVDFVETFAFADMQRALASRTFRH